MYVYEDLNDPIIRALADNLRVIDRCFPKVYTFIYTDIYCTYAYTHTHAYTHFIRGSLADMNLVCVQMVMDLVLVQGTFTPPVVAQISTRLGVPRNFMFMVCPTERFPYDLGDFGGIRIITH